MTEIKVCAHVLNYPRVGTPMLSKADCLEFHYYTKMEFYRC